ncbi:Ff.00g074310.m01.CDS01 [Fusarium sp. VM40]|nr:Ff.00g074310.m01.CDS01 [Fusarium sp. VM40]
MASEYRIHKPYVLATLPRPLDHTEGRIVAREVYGLRDGQKKRKRTELVVGVDGETTSIYDVPASRLITSYPIPPQESFTCAPYSVRIRRSGSNDVSRYTYIATRDSTGQKISLFKDVVHQDGKTTSTTIASPVLKTSPIRYVTCNSSVSETSNVGDVIVVCQNGEFISLSAETLAILWTSSSKSALQDAIATQIESFEVDYITSGTLTEFSEGIFKDKPEIFSALPKTPDSEPELVALVSKTLSQGQESRHSVVLAVASGISSASSDIQKLSPLEIVPIGTPSPRGAETAVYQIDVQAALLMQLRQGSLSIYDLTTPVPKLKSVVQMENAVSFARLSRPFVLSCSLESIGLYNHQYRSIHANASLDLSEVLTESEKPQSCQLISYLRSQELVVALVDNVLVSIQIEPPKSHGKRRKQGLLIDSIGRGTATEIPAKKAKTDKLSAEFSKYVPGSMTEQYMTKLRSELDIADGHLAKGDLGEWEGLLRRRFRVGLRSAADATDAKEEKDSQELPEWEWLSGGASYAMVDRRWVLYAIGRTFSISTTEAPESRPKLQLILPDTNVTSYLVVAGHLTLSNLKAAFRDEFDVEALDGKAIVEDLLTSLTDADPSMTLVLNYLQATQLSELELLLAIRALMLNLDLIPDPKKPASNKLLKNEAHDGVENYEMDLDDLERDIAITEYYLGDDSSSRSRGLTLAFTKLWRLPAITTVKAIRATLKTEEILSLIYTLRVELVRGAWTSLYIDPTSFDSEGNDPPPDGVITLISDLLGRCLDAVGAGGWLLNDAISSNKSETGDLLTALKLEVTAALEGLEEAVYLNGIVGEAVGFGLASQKGGAGRQVWNANKPVPMQMEGRESRLLPLGLKTKQMPTKSKIVSGGEVVQRSTRETGHLISQKVEAYSLEKLAI